MTSKRTHAAETKETKLLRKIKEKKNENRTVE